MEKKLYSCIFLACLLFSSGTFAQITLLGSFNPSNITSLCGIGYNPDSSHVWVYGCSDSDFHCYDTAGTLLNTLAAPGENANDVDIEIAPEALTMNGNSIPKGQVLFINGETDSAEIYAVDNVSGTVTDTLFSAFGTDHVVGGAYHAGRNTFFMVQDNVPGATLENLIGEVDPLTGDTLQTFQITNYLDVYFGDMEAGENGNLFVVSSDKDSIAEFLPTGTFVQMHALPPGVTDLSGIALDCDKSEAWVSGHPGTVFHLGNFPCGTTNITEITQQQFYLSDVTPNPFSSEISFSVLMKQQGKLKITLTNMLGEEVKTIYDGNTDAGKRNFSFAEKSLATGVYFLKVQGNDFTECKRIVCMSR
ncbi:MAG TPA: T9SS type A sorting domain-containing protein [Bacteroidia bacterium]|nr:T9SS type A sorting domain-containing protein [Bacteroidia bacterium]